MGATQLVVHDALEITLCTGIELVVVDAEDDGDVGIPARGTDDHMAGSGLEVLRRQRMGREDAGRLDDDIHVEVAPRQVRRIALGEDLETVPVDVQFAVDDLDGAVERPVNGVVLEEVRQCVRVREIVHTHDVEGGSAPLCRPEEQAADPPEAVDRYLHSSPSPV